MEFLSIGELSSSTASEKISPVFQWGVGNFGSFIERERESGENNCERIIINGYMLLCKNNNI